MDKVDTGLSTFLSSKSSGFPWGEEVTVVTGSVLRKSDSLSSHPKAAQKLETRFPGTTDEAPQHGGHFWPT